MKVSQIEFNMLRPGDRVISRRNIKGRIVMLYKESPDSCYRYDTINILWEHGGQSFQFHNLLDKVIYIGA